MVAMRHGYPARAASVPAARNATVGCVRELGVDESVARAVEMAVTEACSNVVVHAYREQEEPGRMTVVVEKAEDLCITVSDNGLGIAPRLDSPGLGMGLPLISHLADELELRSRPQGGSEVSMRFHLASQLATA
jgi:anti-sigma regulatory factor (Ser/Thr protein kinase)